MKRKLPIDSCPTCGRPVLPGLDVRQCVVCKAVGCCRCCQTVQGLPTCRRCENVRLAQVLAGRVA